MTRETKAGLLMILMLVGVFGFMVYKRIHHPAQALAQQNPDSATAGDVADESPESPSVVGNDPAFPATPQIISAGASEPAPIPVDSPNDSRRLAVNPETPAVSPRESDPFGNEFHNPNHRKPNLPTSVPDEPGFSEPVATAETQIANDDRRNDIERHDSSTAATNEVDPFSADEKRTTRNSDPRVPTAAVTAAEPVGQDPFSAPVTDSSPQKRPALPTELDSDPFSSSTAGPSASDSATEFEKPERNSDSRHPSRQLLENRDAVGNDAFEAPKEFNSSNASVPELAAPSPQSPPSFEPVRQVPELAFQRDSTVAQLDQFPQGHEHSPKKHSHNNPFSGERREETRSANVPDRKSESNRTDDRFGGFRPATDGQPAARTNSDASSLTTPDIAVGSAVPSTRRPAPISEIDEDFAPRASSTPLIAGDTYKVEPNENFWTISRKKYGTGRYFMALAQHNSKIIPDPKRMQPGATIATPSAESLERAYPNFIPKAGLDSSAQSSTTSTGRFNVLENGVAARTESSAFDPGDTYRVEPSEDFWTISRKRYGTGRYFMALAQHNAKVVPDPRKMRPGVTIATPSAESLERAYPDFIPKATSVAAIQTASTSDAQFPVAEADAGFFLTSDGSPLYRIGSEDTLSGIAQRHLGRSSRWVQIFEMNRDVLKDGNSLKVGALLKLPSDASRVDMVGGSRPYR